MGSIRLMITTHVLDLARGRPAAGVAVVLERLGRGGEWLPLGAASTDADGRVTAWPGGSPDPARGTYRLRFDTAAYFRGQGVESFHAEVTVAFELVDVARHCHVPLLLSPFGYSTYRGT